MKYDLAIIESILVEQDPEGLISMGCPHDEYNYEAIIIFNRINNETIRNKNSIMIKVMGVFFESFGTTSACTDTEQLDLLIDKKYINFLIQNKSDKFKTIAKLIFESGKE